MKNERSRAARVSAVRAVAALLTILGIIPLANILSGGRAIPWWSPVVTDWLLLGGATIALVTLIARARPEEVDAMVTRVDAWIMRPASGVFALSTAAIAVLITAFLSVYCFNRQPHSVDEMAQLWHARILLAGGFALPPPPYAEFVSTLNVVDRTGWYSQFPVGGPALLALGLAAGAAWLVNPVLTGVATWSVYRFAARAYGERTARYATVLMLATPFFLFMGATYQNHVPALTLTWVALAALASWQQVTSPGARLGAATAIGAAVGGLATVRPLDALLVALVIGGCQLVVLARAPARTRELIAQLAAGAVPIALLLLANTRSTGHPFLMAYDQLWGPQRLGFGATPVGPPHTPLRALGVASVSLMRLDAYLFEWPIPSLLPVILTLALLRRPSGWDTALAALIAVFVVGYGLYWHEGFYLGPRYLFTAVPAFVLVAVRAPSMMADAWPGAVARAARLAVPALVVVGLVRAGSATGMITRAREYRESLWMLKTDLPALVGRQPIENALVFIHEPWESRLAARLWASGLTRGEAERLLTSADACALQSALDRLDAASVSGETRRVALLATASDPRLLQRRPDITADAMLRFDGRAQLSPACVHELAADTAGTSLFAPFLLLDAPQRDGSIGGPVVFVRDLGARDSVLRPVFAGRRWYRWRPMRGPTDTTARVEAMQ